ncbi:hypothetical protein SKAU_G00372880 [Synaphobranchus kaupii]|uniref:Uncharacterized protein n=1 Tax=Synaphobranchus kaupii TaxID=118154 RepID=A0A9Q1EGE4_SYNKA|nr:hypothetical protein SKAU_G00372880 [Synaphobranchus kaupii]
MAAITGELPLVPENKTANYHPGLWQEYRHVAPHCYWCLHITMQAPTRLLMPAAGGWREVKISPGRWWRQRARDSPCLALA